MAINFPSNPSVDDTHTENEITFKWNGTVWKAVETTVEEPTEDHITLADLEHGFDGQFLAYGTDGAPERRKLAAGDIPDLSADKITSDTFDADRIPDLPASKITSDTFDADRIPDLPASKITSDTFDTDRIPSLNANKINAGTMDSDRLAASGTDGQALIKTASSQEWQDIITSNTITTITTISQDDYDALATPDSSTLYLITG